MDAHEIRQIRKRLGLTQEDFAERLGTNRHQVIRWERGKNKPIKAFIMAIRQLDPAPRQIAESEPAYDAG